MVIVGWIHSQSIQIHEKIGYFQKTKITNAVFSPSINFARAFNVRIHFWGEIVAIFWLFTRNFPGQRGLNNLEPDKKCNSLESRRFPDGLGVLRNSARVDLSKLINLAYNIKNSEIVKGNNMRTRTRQKEQEEQAAKKHKTVQDNGDFLSEDLEKVKKLLAAASAQAWKPKADAHLSDDKLSTDAENCHVLGGFESGVQARVQGSQMANKKLADHTVIEISSSGSTSSKKERIRGSESCSPNSSPELHSKSLETNEASSKKRTKKELSKIQTGFDSFFELIKSINSNELPQLILDWMNEDRPGGAKKPNEEAKQMLMEKEFVISKKAACKKNKAKTLENKQEKHSKVKSDYSTKNECSQISNIVQEISREFVNARLGRLEETQPGASIYLVEENTSHYVPLRRCGGYPLSNNQSLHVQLAYSIAWK